MKIYIHLLCLSSLLLLWQLSAAQVIQESMDHDGETRNYRFYVPPAYDGEEEVPLIFVLHGLGDSGAGIMQGSGFNAIADTANFIAVYPDALGSFGGTAWNSGTPLNTTVDDFGFLAAILESIGDEYDIDEDRIFSCGYSMGGIMSHRLACEWNDVIKAVASQSGCMANTVLDSCDPGRSVAVLHIHGTDDVTVAYDGTPLFGLSSVPETVGFWADNNACDASPESVALEDSANDGYTVDLDRYENCEDSQPVHLYTVNGMGHSWMNSSNDVSTSVEMWNFFRSLDEPSEPVEPIEPVSTEILASQNLQLYPNPVQDVLQYQSPFSGRVNVTITDVQGRLLRQMNGMSASGRLNINTFSPGVYQITVNQQGKTYKQRFVVN